MVSIRGGDPEPREIKYARLVGCDCSGIIMPPDDGLLPKTRVCEQCGADVRILDLLDFPAPEGKRMLLTRIKVVSP